MIFTNERTYNKERCAMTNSAQIEILESETVEQCINDAFSRKIHDIELSIVI